MDSDALTVVIGCYEEGIKDTTDFFSSINTENNENSLDSIIDNAVDAPDTSAMVSNTAQHGDVAMQGSAAAFDASMLYTIPASVAEAYVPGLSKFTPFDTYESLEDFKDIDAPSEALYMDSFGTAIKFKASVVTMKNETMFGIVSGSITCPFSRPMRACAYCPARDTHNTPFAFSYGEEVLNTCFQTDIQQKASKIAAAGVPATCKRCSVRDGTKINITRGIVQPYARAFDVSTDTNSEPIEIYTFNMRLEESSEYVFYGHTAKGPKSRNIIVVVKAEPVLDDTNTFELSDEQGSYLRDIFSVSKGQSVEDKVRHKARNIAHNVTGLSGANVTGVLNYHIALDTCYHSVLAYPNEHGNYSESGIVSFTCIGDSRTGKSRGASQYIKHYGLGDFIPCDTATVSGLTAALTQGPDNTWYAVKGALAKNDRGLMVMDELSVLSPDALKTLGSARSEGRVVKTGVAKATYYSRVRLALLSNPRHDMTMDEYNSSLKALVSLYGKHENLARNTFSMAMKIRNNTLERLGGADLYRDDADTFEDAGDLAYPSEACKDLVLWAWSRKPEDVVISKDTWNEIHKKGKYLSDRYSDTYQLVKRTNIESKLTCMACAVACMVFSSSDDYKQLIVLSEHVDYASKFLDEIYIDIGYLETSKAEQHEIEQAFIAKGDIAAALRYSPSAIRLLLDMPTITDTALRGIMTSTVSGEEFYSAKNMLMNYYYVKSSAKGTMVKTAACVNIFRMWLQEYALHGTINGVSANMNAISAQTFSVVVTHHEEEDDTVDETESSVKQLTVSSLLNTPVAGTKLSRTGVVDIQLPADIDDEEETDDEDEIESISRDLRPE